MLRNHEPSRLFPPATVRPLCESALHVATWTVNVDQFHRAPFESRDGWSIRPRPRAWRPGRAPSGNGALGKTVRIFFCIF